LKRRQISLDECREALRRNPLTPARVVQLIKQGTSIAYWNYFLSGIVDEPGGYQIRIVDGMSLCRQELTLWHELVHLHLIDLCYAISDNIVRADFDAFEEWVDETATQLQKQKMFEFYELVALLKNNHLVW